MRDHMKGMDFVEQGPCNLNYQDNNVTFFHSILNADFKYHLFWKNKILINNALLKIHLACLMNHWKTWNLELEYCLISSELNDSFISPRSSISTLPFIRQYLLMKSLQEERFSCSIRTPSSVITAKPFGPLQVCVYFWWTLQSTHLQLFTYIWDVKKLWCTMLPLLSGNASWIFVIWYSDKLKLVCQIKVSF